MLNKKRLLTLVILISLLLNFYNTTFAEPFYFYAKLINDVKQIISEKKVIGEKIKYLDDSIYKLSLINNTKKELIIRDIKTLKKDLIKTNLRSYTINKYFTGSKIEFIKKYKPYYLGLKNSDLTADIHINYINYLEGKITEQLDINENDNIYKGYIYVLYSYKNKVNLSKVNTQDTLNSLEDFSLSNEFLLNKDYYKNRFDKLVAYEKFNKYSKSDFNKIYSKIVKQNISPDSDYMKGFSYWYANYKNILTKTTITLKNNLYHEKQKYSLSCEANSTRDLINYYNLQNNKSIISEDEILSAISSHTGGIIKNDSNEYLWADPNKAFVGSFSGKQSINPDNFSGYGVYANPIINATKNLFPSNLEVKKIKFSEKDIVDSIIGDNPIMFWYLTEVKIGKKNGYQTNPIVWKTREGNTINGYIGEHTGVIIGFDISKDGRLEKLYYYEGKTNTVQTMDYNFAKQVASFFDEMIVINKNTSNPINLVYNK